MSLWRVVNIGTKAVIILVFLRYKTLEIYTLDTLDIFSQLLFTTNVIPIRADTALRGSSGSPALLYRTIGVHVHAL